MCLVPFIWAWALHDDFLHLHADTLCESVIFEKLVKLDAAEGEFVGIASFRREVVPALKEKTKQLLKEKEFSAYFESAIQRLIDEEEFRIEAVSTKGLSGRR